MWDTALAENCCSNQSLRVDVERVYLLRLLALHDATREILPPPFGSAMVLDVFNGTMILSVIRRLLYDTESRRGVLGPEGDKDGSSTTEPGHRSYQPMMLVLESSDKNLYAFFQDFQRKFLYIELDHERRMAKEPRWYSLRHMIFPPNSSVGRQLVEELRDFIDQFESKRGLAGTVRGEGTILEGEVWHPVLGLAKTGAPSRLFYH